MAELTTTGDSNIYNLPIQHNINQSVLPIDLYSRQCTQPSPIEYSGFSNELYPLKGVVKRWSCMSNWNLAFWILTMRNWNLAPWLLTMSNQNLAPWLLTNSQLEHTKMNPSNLWGCEQLKHCILTSHYEQLKPCTSICSLVRFQLLIMR
jgi:hypothetical protein